MQTPHQPFTLAALAALLALPLQGCAPVIIGGAAVGATVAAHDRRTAGTVVEDENIELKVRARTESDQDIRLRSDIGITSYNRVVLLSGQAESPELKDRIGRVAANVPGVKRVVNELVVGRVASFQQASNDAYVTSRVKVALFEIRMHDFDPSRIKVVTELGVVYLMGLVTPAEARAAVEKARYIKGVNRVVKVFEYL